MMIEGMVCALEENRCTKRNVIAIQISKEDFDALMTASYLGDEYEICGKTVVIRDKETDKKRNETAFLPNCSIPSSIVRFFK